MQKCQVSKFVFDPHQTSPFFQSPPNFGAPRLSGWPQIKKFHLMWKFQKIFFPCPFSPHYFGPYHKKIKILPLILFSPGTKVSKKVCHTSAEQKLRKDMDFLEIGCFQPRAVLLRLVDQTPPPKNCLYVVGLVLKSSRSFHSIKCYSTLSEGQTDRYTDKTHVLPLHIEKGKKI